MSERFLLPACLSATTLENVLGAMRSRVDAPSVFEAGRVEWADPYAVLTLYCLSEKLDVPIHGSATPGPDRVLLPAVRLSDRESVDRVVECVRADAPPHLRRLGLPGAKASALGRILSELGHNVVEHANAHGLVALWRTDHELRIGVCDGGQGLMGSLASRYQSHFGARWNDAAALETAFREGRSRDPIRGGGAGLAWVRREVVRWGGRMLVRSGTARIRQVPDRDPSPPLTDGLSPLPGTQVGIMLPGSTSSPAEEDRPPKQGPRDARPSSVRRFRRPR